MKSAFSLPALLLLSGIALGGLLVWEPFERANEALDYVFGAPPKWTQVARTVEDPNGQEISRGEQPAASLRSLSRYWAGQGGARRVFLMGNSQMLSVSLAEGEAPPAGPEPTYVDLLGSSLAVRPSGPVLCYRLAAPGMSYTEAFWYALYLSSQPGLHPDAIVLQLNYQSFWNGGVRAGMQELLADSAFRNLIEQAATGKRSYAETFREALKEYDDRRKRAEASGAKLPAASPGDRLETAVREVLGEAPVMARRRVHKDSFLEMLYRLRVYILGIKPSTERSITGPRLRRSQESIEAVAALCKEQGIALILFQAPLNPQVSLYKTAADQQQFMEFLHHLESAYGLRIWNFERTIEARHWGKWMNGPDPLHLSRAGHVQMARSLGQAVESALPPR